MDECVVKCYIINNDGEECSFEEYFDSLQAQENWVKAIESEALTNFYKREITII